MSRKRPVIQCLPVAPVPIARVLYSRGRLAHIHRLVLFPRRAAAPRTRHAAALFFPAGRCGSVNISNPSCRAVAISVMPAASHARTAPTRRP
jgi:hypothetical protein